MRPNLPVSVLVRIYMSWLASIAGHAQPVRGASCLSEQRHELFAPQGMDMKGRRSKSALVIVWWYHSCCILALSGIGCSLGRQMLMTFAG